MTPQDLKNSILQLAIQGKLVPQIESEGNAEDLYREIQKEKQRLIAEKKIKKEKPLEPIKEEDIPFEIPSSWKYVKLREICNLVNGKAFKPEDWSSKGLPIVRIQNLNNANASYNYYDGFIEDDYALIGGELLFAWSGTPGTSFGAHIWTGGRAVLNQHIFRVDFLEDYIDKSFLKYAINERLTKLISIAHGSVGLQHIKRSEAENTIIALPPLEEQKRIVAKVEELLPLVEKYGKAYERLEDFNKRFPDEMKKSILQMAIQGKLVEQRPEEGTAEELYELIQTEKARLIKEGKIKKEKPLTAITDDEKPFDIPDSWKWVRLNSVISLLSGQDLQPTDYNSNSNGIPYLTGASNIEDGQVIINRWTDKPKAIARRGNLLLTCKGTVGKMSILEHTEVHIARQIMAITNVVVDVKYVQYFIDTQIGFLKSLAKSMIPGIERDNVLSLCFPLPPLEEQKRIVAKIEELLPLCERLKK